MDRYLIESPHDPEECDNIIQEVHNAGYLQTKRRRMGHYLEPDSPLTDDTPPADEQHER